MAVWKKGAYYAFSALFCGMALWVLLAGLAEAAQPPHKILLCAGLLCAVWLAGYGLLLRRADAWSDKACRRLAGGLLALFWLAATAFGCRTMTYPISDLEVLCNAVRYWVEHGDILPYSSYFTICANTLGNCIFLYFIYKPLALFGITMGSDMGEVFGIAANTAMVTLAVWAMWRLGRRLFPDHGRQLAVLLLALTFAPFYLWSHRYYSDTLAMPFVPLAFLLYLRAREQLTPPRRIFGSAACGVLLWLGYCMKGSVIVTLVAVLLYAVFSRMGEAGWRRALLQTAVPVLAAFLLCQAGWSWYAHHNNWIDYSDEALNKYPATMWLMYGAHDDGNYSDEDVKYLQALPDYDARKDAAARRLREYYGAYTPQSYLQFLTHKLGCTWGDGKYDVDVYIRESRTGNWTHYFLLEGMPYYALYTYYCNGWHFAALALLLAGAVAALRRVRWDEALWARIVWFGIFLFLCFWETKARYLLTFTPLFPLLMVEALSALCGLAGKAMRAGRANRFSRC